MYFTLLNNKNQYAIDNFLSENSLSKKCANYQFLLAYVQKLCYYHKAISICPHGQAVQDVALSRRRRGFDSPTGHHVVANECLRRLFLFPFLHISAIFLIYIINIPPLPYHRPLFAIIGAFHRLWQKSCGAFRRCCSAGNLHDCYFAENCLLCLIEIPYGLDFLHFLCCWEAIAVRSCDFAQIGCKRASAFSRGC